MVAFTDKNRAIGVAAKNQHSSNIDNTVYDFKMHLCGEYREQPKLEMITIHHYGSDSYYKVNYMKKNFDPWCITTAEMLLSKLKSDAEVTLNSQVTGCVLACPSYFTSFGQRVLLTAAGMAGLNCFYMIKETTAVAIDYGFYKKFPMPKKVFFVDFGQSSIQVCGCLFTNDRLEILTEESAIIGGRDIDEHLAEHFLVELESQDHPLARRSNKKFCLRLLIEVEKLKKKMSIDTVQMPLLIESFLSANATLPTLNQAKMDEICKSIYERVELLMIRCLTRSGTKESDIDAVEIVGGSCRLPAIKKIIHKVFGKAPSNTMNQDEAVARGCLSKFLTPRLKSGFEIIEKSHPQDQAVTKLYGNMMVGEVRYLKLISLNVCHLKKSFQLHSNYRDDNVKQQQLVISRKSLQGYLKFKVC